MKKIFLNLSFFLLCIAIFSFAFVSQAADENMDINDAKTTSPTPLAERKPLPWAGTDFESAPELVTGNYNGFSLEDEKMHYYKINAQPGQLILIKADFKYKNNNSKDVFAALNLYDSDRKILVNNFSGDTGHFEIQWLPPNTAGFYKYNPNYYISFNNTEDFFKISSFTLDVSIEDKFDANSQTDAPKGFVENPVISAPGNYEGYFTANSKMGNDGYDTYKLSIPQGKLLNVKVTPSSSSDIDITIFNSNKEVVSKKSGKNLGSIVETSYSGSGGEDAYVRFYCSSCQGYEPNKYSFELSLSDDIKKKDSKAVSTGGSTSDTNIDKTIKTGILAWLGITFLLPLIGGFIFIIIMIIIVIIIVKKYKNSNSSNISYNSGNVQGNSSIPPQSQPQSQQNYQESGQINENNQNPPSNVNPPSPPTPPPPAPPQA